VEKADDDNCCEHAPVEGYECSWIVDRIILPELGVDDSDDELEDQNNRSLNESFEAVQDMPTEQVISGESGNLAIMALQLGYPILKPFFEEQVRRATVSVKWTEGGKERGFDVIQFLVSEQPARAEEDTTEDGT